MAIRRAGLALAVVAGLLLGTPGADIGLPGAKIAPVAASCAAQPSIDDAVLQGDVVFVGTVVRLENEGRWATVRVEERWRGARDLASTVQVRGGPDPGTATSVDRVFAPDRYLFVVSRGQDFLVDNACSATTTWSDDLARLRPPDVSPAPDVVANAVVTEVQLEELLPILGLALALIVAVVAYLVILRARRRPPDWLR